MNYNIDNSKQSKKIRLTIIFYCIGFLSCYVLNKYSHSGPCVLGLGAMLGIVLLIISLIFLLLNILTLGLKEGSANPKFIVIHLFAFLIIILMAKYLS
jgi:hypothetical protein